MKDNRVWSAVNVSALKNEMWFQETLEYLMRYSLYILAESDMIYHRTVVTFVGPMPMVSQAIETLVKAATKHIDMTHHTGVHYRMGAVDVIPFVPLDPRVDLRDDISLLGERIAREMPVIFYEKSARTPEHQSLKEIRKGGFEAFKESLLKGQKPFDEGHVTDGLVRGCVAIGMRDPLLAFNIEVHTDDSASLQKIARSIRESSGGYPGIDAAVFTLGKKRHHISMNLRRFDLYSIESVTREVTQQLNPHTHRFVKSEVIGLVSRAMSESPEKHLNLWMRSLQKTLKIQSFGAHKVLESVSASL